MRRAVPRKALVGVLCAVVVLTVVIGVVSWGHAAATMPADVEVVDTTCERGNVTEVTAEVTYRGETPAEVTAHVWGSRQHVQHSWEPTRFDVAPGTTRIKLEPPSFRGYLRGDRGQLALYDGQQRLITNWETNCTG